uniref:Uncharacterized protein n=1 Tax=Kalanchoe fedtschenkoi TaxID=63787 RepID=A0A7N0RBC3_KALFE
MLVFQIGLSNLMVFQFSYFMIRVASENEFSHALLSECLVWLVSFLYNLVYCFTVYMLRVPPKNSIFFQACLLSTLHVSVDSTTLYHQINF